MFVCVCLQEELEAQVSLLQGQINDLEAMSKYCAKMMNVHIGESSITPSECHVEGTTLKITALYFHMTNRQDSGRDSAGASAKGG